MSVVVDSVPPSTRKPGFYGEINTRSARLGLPVLADRLLLVGTQLSTATATELELVRLYDATTAHELFGSGSPLAIMVAAALDQNPNLSELWCIPLDEAGAGVAATGTVTVTASSQTAGTLTLYVGDTAIRIAVTAADAAADIAALLNSALGDVAELPISSAVGTPTSKLDITVKAKGTAGNDWTLAWEYTGTGVSLAIVQPTSGATDPDLSAALDIAFPEQFDLVAVEYNDATSLGYLVDHLDAVSSAMEQRPGFGFAGYRLTVSGATTLGTGANSGRVTLAYLRGTRSHPMQMASAVATLVASESDRARPLNNRELVAILPPDDPADKLSRAEQETCLANGVAPLEVGVASSVRLVRWVTTRVTNDLGSVDATLLDGMTIRVLDYTRATIRSLFTGELAGMKLAARAVTPNTTDPDSVRLLVQGKLLLLQDEFGYLQNVEDNLDRLLVELDDNVAGRINIEAPAEIVQGLHVAAARISLL